MADTIRYSQLRAAPRARLSDVVPLRAPFTIYVEPTNICNFKCVYCPESFDEFEQRSGGLFRMNLAAFERLSDQIAELGGVKTLNFYMMGEPFANKDLPAFVRIAKNKGIADRVIVTSNGSLLKQPMAREVLAVGLDYLRISIYGGDAEAHARKTQSKVPFERIFDNVKAFRDLRDATGGPTLVYVKMIDSGDARENQAFLDKFAPISDEAVIEPRMNWNDPEEGNLAQIDRAALLATPHFRHLKKACPLPFYTLVVHSDLRVSVCCADWAKQAVVGDASRQTLAEIWRGDALRDFQLAHLQGRRGELDACRSCTYLHTTPDNIDDLDPAEFEGRFALA